MSHYSLRHLSDGSLSAGLDTSAADDRQANATVLAHIAEFDLRRLYLPTRYPSMFRYCVGHLRMSEDIAFKRVRAARVARQFPAVFDAIADGRLNLSGIALLARHLTRANGRELLAAAVNRSRTEIQEMLARRFPITGATAIPTSASPGTEASLPAGLFAGAETPEQRPARIAQAPGPVEIAGVFRGPMPNSLPDAQVRVRPLAPGRYELVAILDQEAYDQLVASCELLSHAVPSGDLATVLERAIALQHEHLRRRRCAAAARPRSGPAKNSGAEHRPANPRHIPAAVRREVWERDGGQCTFTGTDGHVCGSRERIELDHVVPVARGGTSTVGNLRLLCREHNQYVAERVLGEGTVQARREAAQRRRAADRAHKQAEREREAARKAALRHQDAELGTALRTLGYRGEKLHRALAHCVARAEAPLEERLKYALGRMAPQVRRAEAPTSPPS
jgi:hypothetical protein